MNNLEHFLSDLNNAELLVFAAFRYGDFLGKSKEKIKVAVQKRGLTKSMFDDFVTNGLKLENDSEIACPRCNSSRYLVETDMELRQSQYGSYEKEVHSLRCQICNYNPEKTRNHSLLSQLFVLVGIKKAEKEDIPEINYNLFK